MAVGNLSQPSFFLSSLKVGYVCTPDGVYQPITASNFELYSYGEKGTPPQHQNFIVDTAQQTYLVQIRVEHSAVRYVGGDWESKVYNQFVACTVNGISGQGHAEYLYRHNNGRPQVIADQDPQWYQRIKRYERSLSNMENISDEDFIF
ncbi:GH12415 [Drosophila grimshawi]|uniref:GH12415 n=2 Tax=Drosophila grimshawi TaxID=7222 RepID=B4JIZ6_DROGR|nr:GH12415 [Drosophila grimshawi]